jgi:hypothetical protein
MSRDIRNILHSAFSFVRSIEANRATAAITLDHVLAAQIQFLKKDEKRTMTDATGSSLGDRISKYDQIRLLEDEFAKTMKSLDEAEKEGFQALMKIGIYEAEVVDEEAVQEERESAISAAWEDLKKSLDEDGGAT